MQAEFQRIYLQLDALKERNIHLKNHSLASKIAAMQEAAISQPGLTFAPNSLKTATVSRSPRSDICDRASEALTNNNIAFGHLKNPNPKDPLDVANKLSPNIVQHPVNLEKPKQSSVPPLAEKEEVTFSMKSIKENGSTDHPVSEIDPLNCIENGGQLQCGLELSNFKRSLNPTGDSKPVYPNNPILSNHESYHANSCASDEDQVSSDRNLSLSQTSHQALFGTGDATPISSGDAFLSESSMEDPLMNSEEHVKAKFNKPLFSSYSSFKHDSGCYFVSEDLKLCTSSSESMRMYHSLEALDCYPSLNHKPDAIRSIRSISRRGQKLRLVKDRDMTNKSNIQRNQPSQRLTL